MREWDAERVARAAGARVLVGAGSNGGPSRAAIDSRAVAPGDLFVGLHGARTDGGAFARAALAAGAWGVLVSPEQAPRDAGGAVLVAEDPLLALQLLARSWRRALGCRVVAVTGSTGKTSIKDMLAAVLAPALATAKTPLNLNTEIGLPLSVLAAESGTEALVLEMAMRGRGQIAELAEICEPDVGLITGVGPSHLGLLGSLDAIAATKAELIEALQIGATLVIPAGEQLLKPHLRDDLETVRYGDGGDVRLLRAGTDGVEIDVCGERVAFEPGIRAPHQLRNLLAVVAAARALGVTPRGQIEIALSPLRGEQIELPGDVVVVDDSYNANPTSMRAALDDLARTAAGRRVAVFGEMLELGPDEERFHREVGSRARECGVELLITVGPRAAWTGQEFGEHRHADDSARATELLAQLLRPGDTVLVKGSRAVGLERVARTLRRERRTA